MRDDEDVVFGDGEVELDDVGADVDAVLEGRNGVFGTVGAASAMGVDEDGLGGGGEGCEKEKAGDQAHGMRIAGGSYRGMKVWVCVSLSVVMHTESRFVYRLRDDQCSNIRFMVPRSTLAMFWRAVAIVGVGLAVIGLSAAYLEMSSHFNFEFIDNYFDFFTLASLGGAVLMFAGLICWARQMQQKARRSMAANVFFWPWLTLLVGFGVDGLNMHGTAALAFAVIGLGSILAIVLLLMSVVKLQIDQPAPADGSD